MELGREDESDISSFSRRQFACYIILGVLLFFFGGEDFYGKPPSMDFSIFIDEGAGQELALWSESKFSSPGHSSSSTVREAWAR